jgi:DNA-binding transcriptional MerR regulator
MNHQKLMRIGDLAKLAGVKTDTIRYYEKRGLLPKANRAASGYRSYDERSLKQLRFIKQAQSLGFSLDEIRRILNLRGSGGETCRCVINIAEATLAETETRLAELQAFRDSLRAHLRRWKRTVNPTACTAAEFCNLIESVGAESPKPPQAGVKPEARPRKARR